MFHPNCGEDSGCMGVTHFAFSWGLFLRNVGLSMTG
jgi:hypothetical protein